MGNIKNTYKDIDISFTAHPLSGDVVKKIDDNAIKQSIEILLSLNSFTVPMQPEKASNINKLLFEPMGIDVIIEMKEAIIEVIEKYEPRVTISDIHVIPNYDTGTYEISIIFQILNNIDLSVISFILTKVN